MSIVASSSTRVQNQTTDQLNERVRRQTRVNVGYYAAHPEQIELRLRELDEEWDVERWLEVNSSGLSLLGLVMGITSSRKWLLLPLVIQSFFLQHGVEGWCPPLPIFRRLGIRTQGEIESERYALKALRGDFESANAAGSADGAGALMEAVRR